MEEPAQTARSWGISGRLDKRWRATAIQCELPEKRWEMMILRGFTLDYNFHPFLVPYQKTLLKTILLKFSLGWGFVFSFGCNTLLRLASFIQITLNNG